MKSGRQARRAVKAHVQGRVARIIQKVRLGSLLDALEVKTPRDLVAAMQQNAERMNREGTLRDDELRDLKRFHTLQLAQLVEQDLEQRKRDRAYQDRQAAKMRLSKT